MLCCKSVPSCQWMGAGRGGDNVFVERIWRSVRDHEYVYLKAYDTVSRRTDITRYIDWYNHERCHSSHDGLHARTGLASCAAATPRGCIECLRWVCPRVAHRVGRYCRKAPSAAVDNSAPVQYRPIPLIYRGQTVQISQATSLSSSCFRWLLGHDRGFRPQHTALQSV